MNSYLYFDQITKPAQVHELVNYLDRLEFGEAPKESVRLTEYKKLVDSHAYNDILNKLANEQDLVLEKGNKAEIESFYAVLSTLILKSSGANVGQLLSNMIVHLTKNKDKKVERLSNLSHMYNLFTELSHKYSIFVAILEYALETEQTTAIESQFDTIDTRLIELNCNLSQKRKIYELVLKNIGDWRCVYVYDFWVKYFSAFDEQEKVPIEIQKEAQTVISTIIKDPEILRTDLLLESYVVKSLKSIDKYATTYQLLDIFTNHGYKEFKDFQKSHGELLGQLDIKKEDLVNKIRLLTLNSLASSQKIILYSEISQLLEITESEVEFFVVEAITSDILDARIDQLNKRIIVRHAESRAFGEAQWIQLDKFLDKWKENMASLLKVIQTAKG